MMLIQVTSLWNGRKTKIHKSLKRCIPEDRLQSRVNPRILSAASFTILIKHIDPLLADFQITKKTFSYSPLEPKHSDWIQLQWGENGFIWYIVLAIVKMISNNIQTNSSNLYLFYLSFNYD